MKPKSTKSAIIVVVAIVAVVIIVAATVNLSDQRGEDENKASYTVAFNANGGSGYMAPEYKVSGTYVLPQCTFTAPDGKIFAGWGRTAYSTSDYATSNSSVRVTANTIFYAVWIEDPNPTLYRVTFDANGGSGTMTSVYVEPGTYVLPASGFTAPNNMRFVGWSYIKNGTTSDVISSDSIKLASNVTLYAVWIESGADPDTTTYHNVSFDTDGGTGTASTQSVKDGGHARQPTGITKEGYVLAGWSTSNDDLWDFSTDTVTADMTLTASWTLHWTYSFSGNIMMISVSSDYNSSVAVDWGDGTTDSKLTHDYSSASVPTVTVTVYSYPVSDSATVVKSSRTISGLQGDYVPQTVKVKVTFNAYPGKFPDGNWSRTVKIDKGTTVEEPTDIPVYDDEHVFSYWRLYESEYDFSKKVWDDITLNVQWSDVFITSFDACYDGAPTIPSVKTPSGDFLFLPSPGTRDGYVFAGWYTQTGGAGTRAGDAGDVYQPSSSRTLYARWTG